MLKAAERKRHSRHTQALLRMFSGRWGYVPRKNPTSRLEYADSVRTSHTPRFIFPQHSVDWAKRRHDHALMRIRGRRVCGYQNSETRLPCCECWGKKNTSCFQSFAASRCIREAKIKRARNSNITFTHSEACKSKRDRQIRVAKIKCEKTRRGVKKNERAENAAHLSHSCTLQQL